MISMVGQWIGGVSGENIRGACVLNVENRSPSFGRVVVAGYDQDKPGLLASVELKIEGKNVNGRLFDFLAFDKEHDLVDTWGNLCKNYGYPKENFPKNGNIKAVLSQLEDGPPVVMKMDGELFTDIKTCGQLELTNTKDIPLGKGKAGVAILKTWEEYKVWAVKEFKNRRIIFRGQADGNQLRTHFHRMGRYDLVRYMSEDLPELQRFVNTESSHKYNLDSVDDIGALLSLAQHHGYPTPLLDWSESPFVAAFFAYERIPKYSSKEGHVYIFVFEEEMWSRAKYSWQVTHLLDPRPNISICRFETFNNKRSVPQQSVFTVANVDNFEFFVEFVGENQEPRKNFLTVVALPIADRNQAMDELRLMGITHGSLLPGFDGVCKTLKEKYF